MNSLANILKKGLSAQGLMEYLGRRKRYFTTEGKFYFYEQNMAMLKTYVRFYAKIEYRVHMLCQVTEL
jgi:hypothetical protein